MADLGRKFLYRIFCVLALLFSLYLMIDLYVSKTLDFHVILLFLILLLVILFGFWDWMSNYAIWKKQEQEIKIYQLYIKPLEELTKDIRMRQHEFDNHMNAVLNMHFLIDSYDELVAAQSEYGKELFTNENRVDLSLLRISDKILAGFLYSKIISAPDYIQFNIQVLSKEIITHVSEHSLIEIIGTLVDNAIEASSVEHPEIEMILDAVDDKLIFTIKNQVENMRLEEVIHFFERGFTTKQKKAGHGLGLYQAKVLTQRYKGELTVNLQEDEMCQKICFQVEI